MSSVSEERRLVDAIDYIVSMTVRSWAVTAEPVRLDEAEAIGQTLLEEASHDPREAGERYTWMPTYEVLVAPAFSTVEGVVAHTQGAQARYLTLAQHCATVRAMGGAQRFLVTSEAGRLLDLIETDTHAALTELEHIYG